MEKIELNFKNIDNFICKEKYDSILKKAKECNYILENGTGEGADFLGWVNLPNNVSTNDINNIKNTAEKLRLKCDLVIVIGIGGSYLGSKAVIEALSKPLNQINKRPKKDPIIIYAGHNISSDYAFELKEIMQQYEVGVIVISKSGTTTEPAIAFRYIKEYMEERYGKDEASKRIVAITDKSRGALKEVADIEKYDTFVIEDNIGGRFSVLTAVGLLPIAVAGFNIELLIEGALNMKKNTESSVNSSDNIAEQYAAVRNLLYQNGYKIEIFASFFPEMQYMSEWWKQLYGESEGKDKMGIFPASVIFSTDLHSMGQYIQDGERMIFETFIGVSTPKNDVVIKSYPQNLDKLNFIAGKSIFEVNKIAQQGTILAHVDGGVPCIEININKIDEINIGALIYMFERACGISGYMLGVNPFNQPGVEAYKDNMYALLGKPGYERQQKTLLERLKK